MEHMLLIYFSLVLACLAGGFFGVIRKVRDSVDFLKSYFFILIGYAKRLRYSLGRCATSCIEACFVHF